MSSGDTVVAPPTFLVFGATGQTGRHLTSIALHRGHQVRAFARTPSKLDRRNDALDVVQGSITDLTEFESLLDGVDVVVCMLGDVRLQATTAINTDFVKRLIPAMRRSGVTRMLYQAGGFSAAPGRPLPLALRAVRATMPRGYQGQHEDNEAVMRYLTNEAADIEWIVHRAGISSDGPSQGVLERTSTRISRATFIDCATYSYDLIADESAVHTCDPSAYRR
jgi:putative NADH-flavin reductase